MTKPYWVLIQLRLNLEVNQRVIKEFQLKTLKIYNIVMISVKFNYKQNLELRSKHDHT